MACFGPARDEDDLAIPDYFVRCKICNKDVSEYDKFCPECGRKLDRRIKKSKRGKSVFTIYVR